MIVNDEETLERWINTEANALWERLRFVEPRIRHQVLTRLMYQVSRKLKSRESTQYHVAYPNEEHPTDPEIDVGDRETRKVNIGHIQGLIKQSKDGG